MHKITTKTHSEIEEITRARHGFVYLMLALTLLVVLVESF